VAKARSPGGCLEAGTVSADKAPMRYGSTVDRWERFGNGPTHRREPVTKPRPRSPVTCVGSAGADAQSMITHTNHTAIIDSAAANWTRTAMPKPVIVARVARQAATGSPVRRCSPT
jgi:hypothetical protein